MFNRPDDVTGIINEPKPNDEPTMRMLYAYAALVPNDDNELASYGVQQPPDAIDAWRTWMPTRRLLFYLARAWSTHGHIKGTELTIDYGNSYGRNYATGKHRPAATRPRTPAVREREQSALPRSFEELMRQLLSCGADRNA